MTEAQAPFLSLLVPIYNEAENIGELGSQVHSALAGLGRGYEVILIDDGSDDNTFQEIQSLTGRYPEFKALRLGTNYGQTAALAAGIHHAQGEVIGCIDADLQNDPNDIPKLLSKLDEGYDVV